MTGRNGERSECPPPRELRLGVSVIIPSYRGRDRIGSCLRSLAAQTLEPDRFEVVVVLNGPPDGTRHVLDRFRLEHPRMNLQVQIGRAHV